jgi:multidrug efflux pump
VTIAAAVIFSSVLALSLAPMLCSKLLRPSGRENRATHRLDQFFAWLSAKYQSVLGFTLRMPWLAVLVSAGIAGGAYALLQAVPQEYAPTEDQGSSTVSCRRLKASSFEQMASRA